ncbi:MAG: MFS transporter [Planctomycetes bacterium]|nr:MFS transporter [Planctomycetota bacterium]
MNKTDSPKSRQRFVLVTLLFFHSANTYMDRACIATAADSMMKDLSISKEMWGLILGIFAVGYALFQIPSGWIADRFGARKALTIVVSVWSCFTALTGAAMNAGQLLVLRFLFGMGEAGAFPGATQAFYRWLPVKERGLAHGINFSGSRLGGALSLFLMPWLIAIPWIGWRGMFVINGLIGIVWATVWLLWFRDDPQDNKRVSPAERDYIEKGRTEDFKEAVKASFAEVFTSSNMSLAMLQYFASNVTFFISLTWLPSYIKSQWPNLENAVYYAAVPLVFAAFANWIAGSMVTGLYNKGYHVGSRRCTAITGFSLGILGLLAAIQTDSLGFLATDNARLLWFVACFGLATFGVDMTLSPSWAFCNDIGGDKSGAVSGAMNMVGNIGAALSAFLFPLLLDKETGSANTFFALAISINVVAILCWCFMNPNRVNDRRLSPAALRARFIALITVCTALLAGAIGYNLYSGFQKNKAAMLAANKPAASTDANTPKIKESESELE